MSLEINRQSIPEHHTDYVCGCQDNQHICVVEISERARIILYVASNKSQLSPHSVLKFSTMTQWVGSHTKDIFPLQLWPLPKLSPVTTDMGGTVTMNWMLLMISWNTIQPACYIVYLIFPGLHIFFCACFVLLLFSDLHFFPSLCTAMQPAWLKCNVRPTTEPVKPSETLLRRQASLARWFGAHRTLRPCPWIEKRFVLIIIPCPL